MHHGARLEQVALIQEDHNGRSNVAIVPELTQP